MQSRVQWRYNLNDRVFPPLETEKDTFFWKRCKLLDWVNYDHLEIIPRNRCEEMWEYAAYGRRFMTPLNVFSPKSNG